MPSLKYKLVERILRATGSRKIIAKALASGKGRSEAPPKKHAARFERSQFQGRDIWTVHPKSGATKRAYIHQHGGAYVLGLGALHYDFAVHLAGSAGVTVILPDYPPVPAGNAQSCTAWACAHFAAASDEWGLENLVLGGDSAGGNLALAIAQMRRAAELPQPAHLLLMSPWVDLEGVNPALDLPTTDIFLEPNDLRAAGAKYAGEMDVRDPLVSPIHADLSGLAPMSIFTGGADLLHADILLFAQKAKQEGTLAKLAVYGDYGHIWMFYPTKDRDDAVMQFAEILRGN